MNDEKTPTEEQPTFRQIRKRIIPHEQSDPAVEPLFINFVHAALFGDDVYMDVGVLTLESLDSESERIGDFAVLNRLVMSKRTMLLIREQINGVLNRQE